MVLYLQIFSRLHAVNVLSNTCNLRFPYPGLGSSNLLGEAASHITVFTLMKALQHPLLLHFTSFTSGIPLRDDIYLKSIVPVDRDQVEVQKVIQRSDRISDSNLYFEMQIATRNSSVSYELVSRIFRLLMN